MSMLIKGMTMPKCCEDCPLGEESDSLYYSCYPQGLDYTHDSKSGRMPNCPLIEVPTPHGKLIDADAMNEKYGDWYTEEGTEEGFIGALKYLIAEQPIIIEAEGE